MRLIDADAFIGSLEEYINKPITAGLVATLVELHPTAYDVEEVLAELEASSVSATIVIGSHKINRKVINAERAISIVKAGEIDG